MFSRRAQENQFLGNNVNAALAVGWIAVALIVAAGPAKAAPAPQSDGKNSKISFNDTIQPILSENCYACHGPDPGGRKAGLRLDRGEFAFAPHQDAHNNDEPAIIPSNPDTSPPVRPIENNTRTDRMPPPHARNAV